MSVPTHIPTRGDRYAGAIVTYTGRVVYPLDPDPATIAIEDIAHALSNSCRFTGHVRSFYSVAQHSVLVSEIVPARDALCGLLHDASEAYLSDLSRPIKQQPGLGDIYRAAEERLMETIAARFGFAWPAPPSVHAADNVLLRTEQRDLMPPLLHARGPSKLDRRIATWLPTDAKHRFLDRYYELTRKDTP